MKKELKPVKHFGGTIEVPGDKSIAHRAALFSILASNPVTVINFPDNEDCSRSLKAAEQCGVVVEQTENGYLLTPSDTFTLKEDTVIDCGNSGTTARLLAGLLAGSGQTASLSGDESLSSRPMKRIIEPLSEMGAELFADDNRLPIKVSGKKLLPFEYRLPVASAQVKSSLLLAALSSRCSIRIIEDSITRDHTERMIAANGSGIESRVIKPVLVEDEHDPRKKRMVMPEDFKKEINLTSSATIHGGEIDIPGDISTAAFFMAGAALSNQEVTIKNVGLNQTRTGFLDHLKAIGAKVSISDKVVVSGEPRGTVTVLGDKIRSRKISGDVTVELIDEIPMVAVLAAFADGTTIIRDAAELKVKESDRLAAIAHNLNKAGIKCGLLEDGLAIEGKQEFNGADFESFGDHRIAMAFSIGALFAVGPSSIDDAECVGVSCKEFYTLLDSIAQ